MNPSSFRLWEAVPAAGKPISVGNRDIPLYSEWVRLLVGRSLAFAQRGPQGNVEYLVLGVPLPELSGDQGARARVREAVNVDFDVLRDSLRKHRQIVTGEPAPTEQATTFLRAYQVLGLLRLPESDREWRVTDEGLTIVQWGLETGRPFFDWTDAQLEAMRDTLLKRVDQQLPDNGGVMAQQRRHSEHEGRQQTEQIDEMLADLPAAAPRTPTRSTTGSPIALKPQTPAAGTSPVTAQHRRHVKWIPAALGEWDGRQVSSLAALLAVALAAGLVAGLFVGKRGTGGDETQLQASSVDRSLLVDKFKALKQVLGTFKSDSDLSNADDSPRTIGDHLFVARSKHKALLEKYNGLDTKLGALTKPQGAMAELSQPDREALFKVFCDGSPGSDSNWKGLDDWIAELKKLMNEPESPSGSVRSSDASAVDGGAGASSPSPGGAGPQDATTVQTREEKINNKVSQLKTNLRALLEKLNGKIKPTSELNELLAKLEEINSSTKAEVDLPEFSKAFVDKVQDRLNKLESEIDPPATNPVASSTEGDQGAKQDGKKSDGTKKNEGQQQTAPPAPPASSPSEPNTPPAPSVPPPDTSPTPPPNSNNVTAGDKKGGGA